MKFNERLQNPPFKPSISIKPDAPPRGRVIKPGGSVIKINERLPFWQMHRRV
jgi:hypothetical protein